MSESVQIGLTEPQGPPAAPVAVLAHSLGTGPLLWEKVVPGLAEQYRVSLLTLPGHGDVAVPAQPFSLSDLAGATAAAVGDLGAGPVLFAGVSIGGALALTLAVRHPEALMAAVPIASTAAMGDAAHWQARAAMVRQQSTSALVTDSASRWFAPDSIVKEPDLTGRILRTLAATSDEGYARCAESLGTYDVAGELGGVNLPVLAMAGEHDPIAPPHLVEEMAGKIPGARALTIPGAGHQPPAEQPARVLEHLSQFFDEVT